MFFWFLGVSVAFVWFVFRSPALDYRLVMLGSILPIGEVVFGGPKVLHSLIGSVASWGWSCWPPNNAAWCGGGGSGFPSG